MRHSCALTIREHCASEGLVGDAPPNDVAERIHKPAGVIVLAVVESEHLLISLGGKPRSRNTFPRAFTVFFIVATCSALAPSHLLPSIAR